MASSSQIEELVAPSSDVILQFIECIPDAAIVVNERGIIEQANATASDLFGWSVQELCGSPLDRLLPPKIRAAHSAHFQAFFSSPSPRVMGQVSRLRGHHASGRAIPLDISLGSLCVDGRQRVLCCIRDVSDRVGQEERIRRLAYVDGLTGLPNRRSFSDQLGMVINRANASSSKVGLLFVDLDHFKRVNDIHGHQSGDVLINEIARRLTTALRVGDTLVRNSGFTQSVISRLGGDEFTCLVEGVRSRTEVMGVAQRLIDVLTPPVDLGGYSIKATASIGVALYPDDAEDVDSLVRAADFAMYSVKNHGGAGAAHFDESAHRRLAFRNRLIAKLPGASERGELSLVFQPVFGVASGLVEAFEALIRWHEPGLGEIPPDEFIGVAEEIGVIHEIGYWVFEEACRTLAAWEEAGTTRPVRLWINLSAIQLRGAGLVERLVDVCARYRIPHQAIGLEITETAILDHQSSSVKHLEQLSAAGFGLQLDDFGIGCSSLTHLCKLSVSGLKIDRSFVHDLLGGTTRDICQLVFALARNLDLCVTAEGIEAPEQARLLIEMGCTYLQGNLLGRPMDECAALARLTRQP